MNKFLHNTGKHSALTENLAVAHSTTGSVLADQFSKSGAHRGRDLKTVFAEQSYLHNHVPEKALKFVFYLRLVSRKVTYYQSKTKTEAVQKGQGNRDESFKRFLWYANNHPDIFYDNIWMFAAVGRYQDFLDIMFLAEQHDIDVNRQIIINTMFSYAKLAGQIDLMKKYIPLPKAASKLTTDRAKFMNSIAIYIRDRFGWTDKQMRQYKAEGNAHNWQQAISRQNYDNINFNHIPGRALSQLVNSSFMEESGLLKKYEKWLDTQPIAKFTGYPYELGMKVTNSMKPYQKKTVDKQFEGLIELAEQDQGEIKGNIWCALDTSGSMGRLVAGGNVTAYQVCLSLGIYFSTLNKGEFHKNVIMFDSTSTVKSINGTFTDMWRQLASSSVAWGSTNFQSIVDEIIRIRQRYGNSVPLSDYPDTILVISDMQFNPTGTRETNHEAQMRKLRQVFPSKWVDNFRVIWWDVTGRRPDNHPTHIDEGGTYVFSGFDGSIVTLLLGGDFVEEGGEKRQKTLEESINDALSQEILQQVQL